MAIHNAYPTCARCRFSPVQHGGEICKSCDRVDAMHNRMVDTLDQVKRSALVATPEEVLALAGGERRVDTAPPPSPSVDRRNPKDAAGRAKVPLALLSPIAKAAWCMAQFVGKVKYGAWNWRGTEVLASVYVSAAGRHLDAWMSGETYDPDDGTHHLGNVMACCAILLDAAATGTLVDDRPPRVSHRLAYKEAEALVAPTEARYKDRNPHHYTIADSVAGATLPSPSNQQGENHEPVASCDAPARPVSDPRREGRPAPGTEKT